MKTEITENLAKIMIDQAEIVSREQEAFYNPKMKLNRDFTIAIIKAIGNKDIQIGLPLAGTGVRAIRLLQEVPEHIRHIYINDMDPKAIEFVNENFKLNNIDPKEKTTITCKEGNLFLTESKGFDYIDIDPFGSPNIVLDNSIKFISRRGILGISATDTSALAGTYPKTCQRKYFATSVICPQKHEIGIRILIRKAQLMGLHNNRVLEPIFSYHFEHYYRIFFRVTKSKTKANEIFNKINTYHHHCNKCSYQFSDENKILNCPKCKNEITPAGPMYNGPLNDEKIIDKLLEDESLGKSGQSILLRIKEEFPLKELVGSYDTHDITYNYNITSKSIKMIKEELKKENFRVVTSSINRTAIKTDAPFEKVIKAIKKNKPSSIY